MTARQRLAWVAATTVGCSVGMSISGTLVAAVARPIAPVLGGAIFILAYGAVFGAVLAIAQLVVLPRGAASARRWIATLCAGGAIGFALVAVLGELLGNAVDPTVNVIIGEGLIEDLSGAMLGLALAGAQWRALGASLAHPGRWLAVSAVGAAIGYGLAAALLELFEVPVLRTNLVLAFGGILGLSVGIAQALAFGTRGLSSPRVHAE